MIFKKKKASGVVQSNESSVVKRGNLSRNDIIPLIIIILTFILVGSGIKIFAGKHNTYDKFIDWDGGITFKQKAKEYANMLLPDAEILEIDWKNEPDLNLNKFSSVKEIVEQECYNIGEVDIKTTKAFISAESRFQANAINKNIRGGKLKSIDSGPAQLNDGGAAGKYIGQTFILGDGNRVKATWEGYRTNVRLNIHIGILLWKDYLKRCNGNAFAAYALYNCGEGYERYVKDAVGCEEVEQALRNAPGKMKNVQGANNIKKNFRVQYNKYVIGGAE